MDKIKIMVNGLPGKMAECIIGQALNSKKFDVMPYSLTGPEIEADSIKVHSIQFELLRPDQRNDRIKEINRENTNWIAIDYTHPSAVNQNAQFYCKNDIPFVMGTTGGDRQLLQKTAENSNVSAIIAPNMAKQIAGLQAMMAYAAENFPNLFDGFHMDITESHQQGKADTSGTAKEMVTYFNRLGVPFTPDEINKIRDPRIQAEKLNIPEVHLNGHAWHTYTLESQDKTTKFAFTHNINGRDIYVHGTLDAAIFLASKVKTGAAAKVYSMTDVLRGI